MARWRACPAGRDADRHRCADAQACLALSIGGADELAGYSLAISDDLGIVLGPALTVRTSASTRSMCACSPDQAARRRSISWRLVPLTGLLRHGHLVAWLRCRRAILDVGSRSASRPIEAPLVIPQGLWIAGLLSLRRASRLLVSCTSLRLAIAGDCNGLFAARSARRSAEGKSRRRSVTCEGRRGPRGEELTC